MNVLIVSAVFPPEPVVSSQVSFDIAEDLRNRGDSVTVICPKPTRPFGYSNLSIATEYKFKKIILASFTCPKSEIFGRFRESFSFGKHCAEFLKKEASKFDVIYANTWPLFAQYFLVKAANKQNVPVILHIQDIYPESIAQKQSPFFKKILNFIFVPFDKIIYKNCLKIITISPYMRDYIVKTRNLEKSRVFVVRNWQDDTKFLTLDHSVERPNTIFTFMYLGSINESANVETLIHAFGKAKLPNCKLIIAGEGAKKVDCMLIAQQYPNEKIEFIAAPIDKVHLIQHSADVLLLPLKKGISRTASPSKLAAYMFSGKPIIACVDEDSDTANCIIEAKCGFVIRPENSEELMNSMKMISTIERDVLKAYGENGLNYGLKNLSKTINLQMITSIIRGEAYD